MTAPAVEAPAGASLRERLRCANLDNTASTPASCVARFVKADRNLDRVVFTKRTESVRLLAAAVGPSDTERVTAGVRVTSRGRSAPATPRIVPSARSTPSAGRRIGELRFLSWTG